MDSEYFELIFEYLFINCEYLYLRLNIEYAHSLRILWILIRTTNYGCSYDTNSSLSVTNSSTSLLALDVLFRCPTLHIVIRKSKSIL